MHPTCRIYPIILLAGLLLALLPARTAAGQYLAYSHVETGVQYHRYDAHFSDWRGMYIRGTLQKRQQDLWQLEAGFEERFGTQSFLYKAQHTRHFGRRWFGRAGLSTSNGGLYNPRLRLDAQLARKWFRRERLVTLAGFMYLDARDIHRDFAAILEAQWYITPGLILQGSARLNVSTPGEALSNYFDVVLTQGRHFRHFLSVRAAFGNEAYQVVGPLVTYTDFDSWSFSVEWRQWIRRTWGFSIGGVFYENPFYARNGIHFGLFRHF